MPDKLVSIIIPISVHSSTKYLLARLGHILRYFSKFGDDRIECVVVDSSKKAKYRSKIFEITKSNNRGLYSHLKQDSTYSAARARNHGSQQASGKYLLFFDVDLIINHNFFDSIYSDADSIDGDNKNKFFIYPCLYLTQDFTEKIESLPLENISYPDIKDRYLRGYNDQTSYLAVNTSTILVNRKHFFDVGAYNEGFKGHGYEDFELIHRLCEAYPIVEKGSDYALDYKTNFPSHYRGFRKHYAYYALPNFFREMYTLHLWHPRPLSKRYYRRRSKNAQCFSELLQESLNRSLNKEHLDDNIPCEFKLFVENLLRKSGCPPDIYHGLGHSKKVIRHPPPNVYFKKKIQKVNFASNPIS